MPNKRKKKHIQLYYDIHTPKQHRNIAVKWTKRRKKNNTESFTKITHQQPAEIKKSTWNGWAKRQANEHTKKNEMNIKKNKTPRKTPTRCRSCVCGSAFFNWNSYGCYFRISADSADDHRQSFFIKVRVCVCVYFDGKNFESNMIAHAACTHRLFSFCSILNMRLFKLLMNIVRRFFLCAFISCIENDKTMHFKKERGREREKFKSNVWTSSIRSRSLNSELTIAKSSSS